MSLEVRFRERGNRFGDFYSAADSRYEGLRKQQN